MEKEDRMKVGVIGLGNIANAVYLPIQGKNVRKIIHQKMNFHKQKCHYPCFVQKLVDKKFC